MYWKKHLKISPLFASLILGHFAAYGMGPYFMWPVLMLCLSLFWIVWTGLADAPRWKIALSAFLFGFGYFVSGLWWIGNALLVGGNEFKWAYPFAVVGLPLIFSFYPMLACIITHKIAKGRSFKAFIVFVLMMFLADVARGTLFTGFPWNLYGMTWTNNLAVLQFLSIGGVYGLTFLTIFIFVTPAFVWKGSSNKIVKSFTALVAFICLFTMAAYGVLRLEKNPTDYNPHVVVQMIQPNIPQADKWDPDKRWDNFRDTMQLMETVDNREGANTRIVILPESTLTYHDFKTPQAMDYLRGRLSGYPEKNVYLLSGALLLDDKGYHNSLVALNNKAELLASFDKFHLVPFGEYIPFQKYVPFGPLVNFSGFVEGAGPQTLSIGDTVPPFSPLVCYEVIFPTSVVNKDEKRPDWLVNVTNDAWYGISAGPFQHLAQAQYRAIEEGLPMVRVAQTGFSAVIDPYGRILTGSMLNQAGNVESLLPKPASPTFFSQLFKKGDDRAD